MTYDAMCDAADRLCEMLVRCTHTPLEGAVVAALALGRTCHDHGAVPAHVEALIKLVRAQYMGEVETEAIH